MATSDEAALEWLYDYILQFLRSPGWRVPILSFIDEYCIVFDTEDENKFIYTEIHLVISTQKFKDVIDTLLENLCQELNISPELFVKACNKGVKTPAHRRIFEQVIACDNFLSFKKLMIKRNRELEAEALKMMQQEEEAITQEEVDTAFMKRDEAELEHAIALSIAIEEERNRKCETEDEELQRVIRLSELEYKEQQDRLRRIEEEELARVMALQKQEEERLQRVEEASRREQEEIRRREDEEEHARHEAQVKARQESEEFKRKQEEARRKVEEEAKKIEEKKKAEQAVALTFSSSPEATITLLQELASLESQSVAGAISPEQAKRLEDLRNGVFEEVSRLENDNKSRNLSSEEISRLETLKHELVSEVLRLNIAPQLSVDDSKRLEALRSVVLHESQKLESESKKRSLTPEEANRQETIRTILANEAIRLEVEAKKRVLNPQETVRLETLRNASIEEIVRLEAVGATRGLAQEEQARLDNLRALMVQEAVRIANETKVGKLTPEEAKRLTKIRARLSAQDAQRLDALCGVSSVEEYEYKFELTPEQRRQKELEDQKVEELKRQREEEAARKAEEELIKAQQEHWRRTQEEATRRAAEVAKLNPVNLRKDTKVLYTQNVDISEFLKPNTIDISKQKAAQEDLAAKAEKIVSGTSFEESKGAVSGESLAERQARLKRQRDLLLARKKAERDKEFKDYIDQGGVDLTVKKQEPLPPVINPELEKRKQIAQKIKQSMANK